MMDLPIRPKYPPVETKEVKEWRAAGMPTFQHFETKEQLEAHLKYVEENKDILPF